MIPYDTGRVGDERPEKVPKKDLVTLNVNSLFRLLAGIRRDTIVVICHMGGVR